MEMQMYECLREPAFELSPSGSINASRRVKSHVLSVLGLKSSPLLSLALKQILLIHTDNDTDWLMIYADISVRTL